MPLRLLILLSIVTILSPPALSFDHAHTKWNEVLARYRSKDGRIRYQDLKRDCFPGSRHTFDEYLKALTKVKKAEYESWTKEERMSFLINAYNAFTVKLVVDHYPVKSIKDIGGLFQNPWKKEFFSLLEGTSKSLDPIEHDLLRKEFQDARIHAALNCASVSCPKLQSDAFVAAKLSPQLDHAMMEWLKDDTRNHFDSTGNAMELSKIFDWFKEDFVKSYGGVSQAIAKFGPPLAKSLVKTNARVKYLPYDWKLNETATSN